MSNDTSSDVRDEFRELVADGATAVEASQRVLTRFAEDLQDEDAAPDVWLGLAHVQCRTGRLQPDVRDEALRLIGDGSDLARWERLGAGRASLRKRQAALEDLRAMLLAPQPSPTRVRAPQRVVTEYGPGDLLSFDYGSRRALLLVTSRWRTGGGIWPVALIAPHVLRTDVDPRELRELPLLSVDFELAEAPTRDPAWRAARPWFEPVREIAQVRPGDDAVRVAGETRAHEAPCLVALLETRPDDAQERQQRVQRVGRWDVPDEVLGVLRNTTWRELGDYLETSAERGFG